MATSLKRAAIAVASLAAVASLLYFYCGPLVAAEVYAGRINNGLAEKATASWAPDTPLLRYCEGEAVGLNTFLTENAYRLTLTPRSMGVTFWRCPSSSRRQGHPPGRRCVLPCGSRRRVGASGVFSPQTGSAWNSREDTWVLWLPSRLSNLMALRDVSFDPSASRGQTYDTLDLGSSLAFSTVSGTWQG